MATRKPKEAPLSFVQKVKKITTDDRIPKISGLFCYLLALFLFISFSSYIFTWEADDSFLRPFKWDNLFDSSIQAENWFGKFGALISKSIIYWTFGICSFALIFLLIRIGYRLINGKGSARIWPMFRNVFFTMVLGCTFFELILPDASFAYSGAYGKKIVDWGITYVGKPGTWLLFIFVLLAIAVWFRNAQPELWSLKRFFPEINKNFFSFLNFSSFIDGLKKRMREREQEYYDNIEAEVQQSDISDDAIPVDSLSDNIEEVEEDFNYGKLDTSKEEKKNVSHEVPFEFENIETENNHLSSQIKGDQPIGFEIEENNHNVPSVDTVEPSNEQEPPINMLSADEEDLLKINAELDNIDEPYDPVLELSKYQKPGLDLLDTYEDKMVQVDHSVLNANKDQIVNTLLNYKIEIIKIRATIGPTVTLYEIVPAPGVRISKIKNLEDDIALSLAALGIRIIAPIPGRGTIGIEVPNQNKQIVGLKEVLNSERFQTAQMDLPIAFGKTISNEVFVADLAKMPHLLIAGATGQGKSVGINAILLSIIQHNHPAYVKLVLIDPKKVELSIYSRLENHFMCMLPDQDEPIITDTKKVIRTLNSLVIEMDSRYDLLKKAGVRNIREYNQKFTERKLNPNKGHRFLPFIVLVIDEFADLIMTAGKEIETPIARIAQLARAVGIHLVIATQRPSVKIITGIIKANFPARIAFKVSSKIDSGIILDAGGADQLIGRGDMLLSADGKIVRIQSAFVDTHEVDRIVQFVSDQQGFPTPYMLPDVPDDAEGGGERGQLKLSDIDDLAQEAALLVVTNQHGSTSMIQRRLKLGYNRAGRIMDQLEELGIVGPNEGSKPREVLFHSEVEVNNFFSSLNESAF
ncbi:MAG: DNA translocase FtsK [Saprospiraceae bacterium]|nr:DNA translocase FtsK [Saprospiraceae bacterium]